MFSIPKGFGSLLKKTVNDRRGSPLVEEGVLIGLGLFCFLLLIGVVTGLMDWFLENADNLLKAIENLIG